MSEKLVWAAPPEIGERTAARIFETSGLTPADQSSDLTLLDFGCGEGRYMRLFEALIDRSKMVGVEVLPDRVEKLRQEGYTVELLPIDGQTLPFPDQSFDIVFSSNVIEHIPHPQYLGYLGEIYRVLKPGGRFVVGTPNYPAKRLFDMVKALRTEYTRYYLFDDPTHCNKLSIAQLERDLKQLFPVVDLDISFGFLQLRIKWLQQKGNRQQVRRWGDKIFGYCLK